MFSNATDRVAFLLEIGMQIATHLYSYVIQTERPHPRLGRRQTGRFQVCGEISNEAAKRLINDMSHNSIGPFELVDLKLVETLKEI